MAFLELTSYRRKDINAYLLMIDASINLADYGQPKSKDDRANAHKGKSHTVTIDLGRKADGYYKYKEADGHRVKYGYLLIKGGEIEEEFETETEMKLSMLPELPKLKGTKKQTPWAESIRAEFIKSIGDRISDWSKESKAYKVLEQYTQAQVWIENKDKLDADKFVARVARLEAE